MRLIMGIILILVLSNVILSAQDPGSKALINVALGKKVGVSSSFSPAYPASNTVDGKPGTIWGTGVGNASDYIYVNLGKSMEINQVIIDWFDIYYATHYQVYVSTDAVNWQMVANFTNGNGGTDTISGTITCKFVGVLFLKSNANVYGLKELQVMAADTTQPTPTSTPGITPIASVIPGNIALNKSVTASSTESPQHIATNAVDGNKTTKWASKEFAGLEWITVDLGNDYLIDTVNLIWEAAYPIEYRVKLSKDTVTWTEVHYEIMSDGHNDRIDFSSTVGRYVKIECVQPLGESWGYSLYELEVYCEDNKPSPTNTPIPNPTPTPAPDSPVMINGQLQVIGTNLCNQYGNPIQLRGMSSHGLQWYADCITNESVDVLANEWKADVLRLSLYANEDGYDRRPEYYTALVDKLIDIAVHRGLYVIIDWHQLDPGDPWDNYDNAVIFFTHMATKHGDKPNVIYEICNEPNNVYWASVRSYAEYMIPMIRDIDHDAVIIVGTHAWGSLGISDGSDEWEIIYDPVNADNIMYSFHFYAAEHYDEYYYALDNFSDYHAVFVTEWGAQESSGGAINDFENAQRYLDLMEYKKISWTCWNYSDDARIGAVFKEGTAPGPWSGTGVLKEAGVWIRDKILYPADDFPTN